MDAKAARRYINRLETSASFRDGKGSLIARKCHVLPEERLRKIPYRGPKNSKVWTRNQSHALPEDRPRKNPNISLKSSTTRGGSGSEDSSTLKARVRICRFWMSDNCVKGDKCSFLHSWFQGNGFAILAELEGHKKAVKGIALPSGSEKLYSASSDGTVRVWDCYTGKCVSVVNLGAKVGCLVSEGPWLFIGMTNMVKAWNIQRSDEFSLEGPVGQVNAMAVAKNILFAGAHDGVISAWKGNSETDPFHFAASLRGHSGSVVCLVVGGQRLYSGSTDHTIRVWDLDTLQSIMTLEGHTDAVMSLLYWDQYLLSCSLDGTIKVWVATEGGDLEVMYTHNEEHGALALCRLYNAEGKPVLFCSCNNNTVYLYELPSFCERGMIFSKREVRVIQTGPGGLFFTGDGNGKLTVWNLVAKPSGGAS